MSPRMSRTNKPVLALFAASLLGALAASFCTGCGTFKAMDIVISSAGLDDNAFLKNPQWGITAREQRRPNPAEFCPWSSHDPNEWTAQTDCTSEDISYAIGGCDGEVSFSNTHLQCPCPNGHMNWFPVTYTGYLYWSDYSIFDGDYNFQVQSDHDNSLYDKFYNYMQVEFSSGETVDRWDNADGAWWNRYHHEAVDGCWRPWYHCIDDDQAARWLKDADSPDNAYSIVIGLAGLDCEHNSRCRVELHPAYAMFVETNSNPDDDTWGFFVRNYGNEGGCSSDGDRNLLNVLSADRILRVRIDYPGHHNPHVVGESSFAYKFKGDDDSVDNPLWYADAQGDTVVLGFPFTEGPSDEYAYVGDLHIQWDIGTLHTALVASRPRPKQRSGASTVADVRSSMVALTERIAQLDANSQADLAAQLSMANPVRPRKLLKASGPVLLRLGAKVDGDGGPERYKSLITHTSGPRQLPRREYQIIVEYLKSKAVVDVDPPTKHENPNH